MKRIYFTSTLILLVLFSCSNYANYYYEVTDMVSINAYNGSTTPYDVTDTTFAVAYCIRLHVKTTKVGQDGKGSLVQGESSTINQNKLIDFKIVCLNYFDAVIDSGDVMNDYFLYSRQNATYNQYNTLARMITNDELGNGNINISNPTYETDLYLYLMTVPQNQGVYKFATTAYFEKGNTLSDTVSIYLK